MQNISIWTLFTRARVVHFCLGVLRTGLREFFQRVRDGGVSRLRSFSRNLVIVTPARTAPPDTQGLLDYVQKQYDAQDLFYLPPSRALMTSAPSWSMSSAFSLVNGRGMSCTYIKHETRSEGKLVARQVGIF